ncbi:hypothetical protein [Paraliomyxa miuraensis]|uniref:hypothetical protein n=1 Tax=Paraliomyxa miuraensis TaxID=376150 RepID=UPI00224DEF01|nr:hypothetical protein [Paraliomyxa miuraensis]MCX4246493.1 hypothetical protein [Paraliomyxa miuraensis]
MIHPVAVMGQASNGNGNGRGGRFEATPPLARARRMLAEVAFDVATTAEGRAAGLSVEVWPSEGVWLRVRSGHELRLFAVDREDGAWLMWRRVDPQQSGERTTEGDLGPSRGMSEEELRTFVTRWLAWRTRGA